MADETNGMRASGTVLLTHAVGLHARPSLKLSKLAKTFQSQINIGLSEAGPWINAKSINRVMAAKVPQNTLLYFEAEGEDAPAAVNALRALVEQDFEDDEPDQRG